MEKYYLGIEGELLEIGNDYPVKIGFIGCGSHAFRHIYPSLQFLPVDLVAVCDTNLEKAQLFKRQFGAQNCYTDYQEMLEKESLDAVMVVVGFDTDGSPLYPPIVKTILERGIPVWFEKPPCKNSVEIMKMIESAKIGHTFAQVGFKKMYMPAVKKVREIITSKDFGNINTYTVRYPVDLPSDIRNIEEAGPRRFLDDFVHVASTIVTLVGRPDRIIYRRSKDDVAIVTLLHDSGHVGSIHFCPSASEMCPLEQLEIVGSGANVLLNNNIEIFHYPKTKRLPYGRTESFIPVSGKGAEYFTPEFSLGQLHNKGLFLLGYFNELKEFVTAVSEKRYPEYAHLNDALAVMQLYDAFAGEEGQEINVGHNQRIERFDNQDTKNSAPLCPNCHEQMFLKDGWNYNCKNCGRMVASSELE